MSSEQKKQNRIVQFASCILPTAFFFLLTAHCSQLTAFASSWTRQPSGTMAWLHAIHFLDQNRGWVAGSNGTLLQTIDGGASWKRTSLGIKDDLRDVYFSDETTGWILAQRDPLRLKPLEPSSYLLSTNDGGVTWQPLFLNTTDVNTRFARLVFTDAQHGWVFGETGALFATTDGGAHWIPQRSATNHLLLGGAVANDGRGFLVGAGGTILRSNDYGATWQSLSLRNSAPARLSAVSVIGNIAWTVGGDRIFRTIDSGRTWSIQQLNTSANLFDIKFIDAKEGWAVGNQGMLLHTSDGGMRWSVESIQSARSLERLFVLDRNHAWVVGFGGTILKLGATNAPPQLKS